MESWQYIALLGAVIAVTAAILPKNKLQQTTGGGSTHKQIEQMELSFEQFMGNMEKDHDELVKMLSSSLQNLREEDLLKSDQITRLEKRCAELERQLSSLSHDNVALDTKISILSTHSIKNEQESVIRNDMQQASADDAASEDENSIHNRYPELFAMYDEGKSIEAIAKKLGKNKGEVQLILQLAKQEENARHA